MQRYLNLSTRAKLFTAFLVMSLFTAVAIVFAYHALDTMTRTQEHLFHVETANVADLKDTRAAHYQIRAIVARMLGTTQVGQLEGLADEVKVLNREVETRLNRIAGRDGSIAAHRDLLREFQAVQDASIQLRDAQILPLLLHGKGDEARELFYGVQVERDKRLGAMADQLVDDATRDAAGSVAASEQAAEATMRVLLAIAVLALLTGAALALLLSRVLAGPLQALSALAERVSAGDLTAEPPLDTRTDEAGVLGRSFRHMIVRLRQAMNEIGDGVAVLASSASQISASTTQVAASSAQTASAVAETSATAEEVKQTARVASDKAAQVQDVAQRTVAASDGGLHSMNQVIESMHEVRQHMDSLAQVILRLADQGVAIGEIIATVNDLADQSNLLSVNAAIEAARAGEEGAGFRVVAQEIRSLADQSKQATVQVKGLLGEIQKATSDAVLTTEQTNKVVRRGVDLSEGATRSLRGMAAAIHESVQAAAQIAASAQQQAVGMDQIAYAMQNINEASAQNVASSRQAEAAAQGLQELGARLKGVVAQYAA